MESAPELHRHTPDVTSSAAQRPFPGNARDPRTTPQAVAEAAGDSRCSADSSFIGGGDLPAVPGEGPGERPETSNEARQSGRLPRGQHTKLTTVGIGHSHLADLALADVDASRPEGDETVDLLFLITVDGWREIEM